MATIDMTHRKINFPPRFLPYLEKHRIFELLHECVELLVQVRPKDHIQFLKTILPCAAMKKDKQRIVFLSPPFFDRQTFAEQLADCLGIQSITRMFLEVLTRQRRLVEEVQIQEMEESVEEESCICLGEGEGSLYPMYFPEGHEATYFDGEIDEEKVAEEETIEKEGEEEKVEEEECSKEPCVCVCPCVTEETSKVITNTTGEKELGTLDYDKYDNESDKRKFEENKEEFGENEEEFGENEPCEPRGKKKKRKKPKISPSKTMTQISESHEDIRIEIDYTLLADCELAARGWILQDFPTTGEEAEQLLALGVIPTHALRIIVDEQSEAEDKEYKELVQKWLRAYKFVPVMEIRMGERTLEKLTKDMCNLLSVMPHRHAPLLFRIVLIGSRGAGVTTQAQKLAFKYGMVHVEFDLVIARALQQDDELCQLYKQQLNYRPDPELEAFLLEKVLLTPACRNRGWVLTGYPRNIDQMRMLDIIATPPNRVIFIEVPPRECFVRLYYRKTDPCLGDEYKIPKIEPAGLETFDTSNIEPEIAARLLTHPKNNKKQILHDIETYFVEKPEMMAYCGKTASCVDGNKTVDAVFEHIEQVLINPAPAHPPRDPYTINIGLEESVERFKRYRLSSGMFFNNLFLNPPERVARF